MRDWKDSLDHYLTTEPDNGFGRFCELVIDEIDPDVYGEHEDWLTDTAGECNAILDKMSVKGYSVHKAAKVLERILKNKSI